MRSSVWLAYFHQHVFVRVHLSKEHGVRENVMHVVFSDARKVGLNWSLEATFVNYTSFCQLQFFSKFNCISQERKLSWPWKRNKTSHVSKFYSFTKYLFDLNHISEDMSIWEALFGPWPPWHAQNGVFELYAWLCFPSVDWNAMQSKINSFMNYIFFCNRWNTLMQMKIQVQYMA